MVELQGTHPVRGAFALRIRGLEVEGPEPYLSLARGYAKQYSPSQGDPEIWLLETLLRLVGGRVSATHPPADEKADPGPLLGPEKTDEKRPVAKPQPGGGGLPVGAAHKAALRAGVLWKRSYPVLEAADRSAPKIERAFLLWMETVRSQITLGEIAEKLEAGDSLGVFRVLDLEERMKAVAQGTGIPPQETSFLEAIQQAFNAGAQAELEALGSVEVLKATIGASMSLNLLNPEAVSWLTGYTFNLIREVSLDQRLAVQDIVLQAFQQGGHPYEQARDIRRMIGLTRTQAQAVRNFRRMLEGDPRSLQEALTRALRDRRFDPTLLNSIRTGTPLNRAQIDLMVSRYYERFLTYRARNIARTESLRASHMGQRELWRQAREQGYLPEDRTRRRWLVTPDDRSCEFCREIARMNRDGVPMDSSFQSSSGPIEGPPAHPSCRCSEGLTFLPRRSD